MPEQTNQQDFLNEAKLKEDRLKEKKLEQIRGWLRFGIIVTLLGVLAVFMTLQ